MRGRGELEKHGEW